jgi:pyruvate kinase
MFKGYSLRNLFRSVDRKTKIVCTLGPKTDSKKILFKLAKCGMNVARLNFSHGDYEEKERKIKLIKEINKKLDHPVGIMMDTDGFHITTGDLEEPLYLKTGEEFVFYTNGKPGKKKGTTLNHPKIVKKLKKGNILLVDDGLISFEVKKKKRNKMITRVMNDGVLGSRKSVTIPGIDIDVPALTRKDYKDIDFCLDFDIDFIAVSFVRKASDIKKLRKFLKKRKKNVKIISKIENLSGVKNFDSILKLSDGIMLARGDLGVEIPLEELPAVQKEIIRKCNLSGKPVIVATHMLNSMINNPRPTRAEVTDIANAVLDGADAVMLSGETSIGNYAVECVKQVDKIAKKVEKDIQPIFENGCVSGIPEMIANNISFSSHRFDVKAIACFTRSETIAECISSCRPKAAVYIFTPYEKIQRWLSLNWGVYSFKIRTNSDSDTLLKEAIRTLKSKRKLRKNDMIILATPNNNGSRGDMRILKI